MNTAVSPKKFMLNGFMKTFNLSVLLGSMCIIDYYLNTDRFTEFRYFFLATVINPNSFDFKRSVFNQIFYKINRIIRGFPVVHFTDYKPGTIINGIKTADLPASAEWVASI